MRDLLNKKKICLVLPDLQKGGMERVMSELAWFFSEKKKTQVYIILLTNQSKIFYSVPPNITIYKPHFKFNKKLRLLSTVKTALFLRRQIKSVSPDAVLSFGETYNSFVIISTLFLGKKIFVSDRSRPDKRWGLIQETLRKILYKSAEGIISQTNFSKEFLTKEVGHKNILVIPNPVKKFIGLNEKKENVILNVGRLIRSKRIDLLLEIFSQSENEGWELWLVGEGDQKEALIKQAQKLGVYEKVRFWDKQFDVNKFYSLSKIFAFTSESEGLPNALLEAMAAGLACISFDCIAGPRDLITNGVNGYLIENKNIEDYVSKLNELINNSGLRLLFSKNAAKKTEEHDIEIIGEKYYNFLLS